MLGTPLRKGFHAPFLTYLGFRRVLNSGCVRHPQARVRSPQIRSAPVDSGLRHRAVHPEALYPRTPSR